MLYEAVREIAERRPHAPAVSTTEGLSLSYTEFLRLVDRTAAGLWEQGVRPGHTVACALPNGAGYVALILAVARTGARYVPLLATFGAEDTATALRLTEPRLIVTDRSSGRVGAPAQVPLTALTSSTAPLPPRQVHAGPFRMLWTSGSTGFPKRMLWRQDRFLRERRRWIADTGITEDDVFFCRHPLDVAHATDLHVFAALLAGAEVVLADPRAEPAVLLRQIGAHGTTAMSALPLHYEEYVRAAREAGIPAPTGLRRPLCGGAHLGTAVQTDAADVLGFHIRQLYGSTEFGLALGNMDDVLQTGTGMRPVAGVGVRLEPLDAARPGLGELVLTSDCTSEGYVGAAEANARTFRGDEFWTGDVACREADGSYRILGRLTELLAATGGPLPAPVLDEEITASCPVRESVALPVHPGAFRPEVLIAVHPDPAATAAQVRAAVEDVAGGHGLRAEIVLAHGLPHTAVGKADKPALRAGWERLKAAEKEAADA